VLYDTYGLQVVGLSNAISGCLGGYSGSYIFSQTIFLMRARVRRRLATLVIFVIQLTVVAMPLSPLPYVPNAFFGAILIFIMIDLAADWLYKAYWKLSLQEYFNLWASFVLIVRFGLETGMLLGCIVCALGFMLAYARSNTHEFVEGRARVIRSRFHAIVLRHALQSNALTCLQLNGARPSIPPRCCV
jgi:SulP family sulfate permease